MDSDRQIPVYIRKEVRARDNNRCKKCGSKERLEFHHIISFLEISRFKKFKKIIHKKDNLILLCKKCHIEAPNNPIEFFKWLKKGIDLPVSFSKCIDLMEMGIPLLIFQRRSLLNKGYNLDIDSYDWEELIKDFKEYLIELWEVQLSIKTDGGENQLEKLSDFISKQNSKIDSEKMKKFGDKFFRINDKQNK